MATANLLDLQDRIHDRLSVVASILECAKVLSALETTPVYVPEGGFLTGEGAANGHLLGDDALPTLLHHGRVLVDELREEVTVSLDRLRSADSDQAEVSHE